MKLLYKSLLAACVTLGTITTNAQIISTVAGSGMAGYDGDGPSAIAKKLYWPFGAAADADDNIYFADQYNHMVRMLTPTGELKTICGTYSSLGLGGYTGDDIPASSASLNYPYGLNVSPAGNLYIADGNNHLIRMIDKAGIIHRVAGHYTSGYSGDGGPATDANLSYPTGAVVDATGNMYIADYGNNVIRKVDASTGNISTFATGFIHPYDVQVDNATGYVYATAGSQVIKIAPDGTWTSLHDFGTTLPLPALKFDNVGNLLVTVIQDVYKVDMSGGVTLIAGTSGGFSGDLGPATDCQMNNPSGLAVNAFGDIYIVDRLNSRVRKIKMPVIPVAPITGVNTFCEGSTTLFKDDSAGGKWTSSNTSVATVDAAGTVTGISVGTAIITYKTSSNRAIHVVSITPIETVTNVGKIRGLNYACPSTTVILSETVPGGVWTSSNTKVASVNATTGLVKAGAPGNTVISYTVYPTCGAGASLTLPFKTLRYEDCNSTADVNEPTAVNETDIQVAPNPTYGSFSLKLLSGIDEEAVVTVMNITGQKIKEMRVATNQQTSITLDAAAGMYFINAISEHSQWSQKIIVNATH